MYFYIFDPRGDKEIKYFERNQGRLLNFIAESRVDGETYRVTAIRTTELLIEQAAGVDAKTVVVVGSDASLNRAINAISRSGEALTLAYIPLDPGSGLAKIFGLSTDLEGAVKILAARLSCELDLGQIGEQYFLTRVDLGDNLFSKMETGLWGLSAARNLMRLSPFEVSVVVGGSYTVTSEVLGLQVINARSNEGCKQKLGSPLDGILDVVLLKKLNWREIFRYRLELASGCLDNVPGITIMHGEKVEIIGPKKLPLSVDGSVYTKAPATIQLAEKRLKMIVGKDRGF